MVITQQQKVIEGLRQANEQNQKEIDSLKRENEVHKRRIVELEAIISCTGSNGF